MHEVYEKLWRDAVMIINAATVEFDSQRAVLETNSCYRR
jgi:hypothetical protein